MGTLPRLTTDQLDLTVDAFDFTQSLSDTLGSLGTSGDGFDSYINDTIALLGATGDPGGLLDSDLNLAAGIAGSIDPLSLQADALSLPASLAEGDAILSDVGALNSAVSVPAPPANAPTSGAPGSDCSQRTNQYGLSATGTFPGVNCWSKDTFQVLRVQDGPCTYSAAVVPQGPQTSFPRIVSFTLASGDPAVWKLGFHISPASDGTPVYYRDTTITPKLLPATIVRPLAAEQPALAPKPQPLQSKSHFDATGILVLSNPSMTLTVCMSVDCIP